MPDVTAYRVFPWDRTAGETALGGSRHVNRAMQGAGRHDSPADYGVYYCSASEESAIGESLQMFRGQKITNAELIRSGLPLSLIEIEMPGINLVDLDEPAQLINHKTRPSIVASARRALTQDLAQRIFRSKAGGISWWSTLLADWTNYSIFTTSNEVTGRITRGPVMLDFKYPALLSAAKTLGIRI